MREREREKEREKNKGYRERERDRERQRKTVPRPHDRRLLDVFRPDPRAPVSDGQKVFRKTRVPLEGVDGSEVSVVDGRDALVGGLGFLVAQKDAA